MVRRFRLAVCRNVSGSVAQPRGPLRIITAIPVVGITFISLLQQVN